MIYVLTKLNNFLSKESLKEVQYGLYSKIATYASYNAIKSLYNLPEKILRIAYNDNPNKRRLPFNRSLKHNSELTLFHYQYLENKDKNN